MYKGLLIVCAALLLSACSNFSTRSGGDFAPGSQADLETNAGDHVLFELDSAAIDGNGASTLDAQAQWLLEHADKKVLIEGHADERGTREYNIALGAKRAEAVKQYLIKAGVDVARLKTVSYGKERPIVIGNDGESWRQNRRAQSVLTN